VEENSLLGIWTGSVHNSNGWDMKITISIFQPLEVGSILGIFDIPLMPCSGSLRVIRIRGETVVLHPVKQQGNCEDSDSASVELLSDGTLLYISKGKDWETRGVLERKDS
jgi:hypothetical protein